MGRPTNYLGHKFQRPWILGLFILAAGLWIARGGDPARMKNFFQRTPPGTANEVDGTDKDNAVVPEQTAALKPGEVKAAGTRPENTLEEKRLFGGLKPEQFEAFQDDTVYRGDEVKSMYAIFKTVRDSDQRDLELATVGRLNFRQLFEQTKVYRGDVVTIAGIVKRIIKLDAPPNAAGIEKFYEVWIIPAGGTLPLVADVIEVPKGFPAGSTDQFVAVTGVFIKRLQYPGEDRLKQKDVTRSAPLVLAKTLTWSPDAATTGLAKAGQDAVDEVPGLRGVPVKWALPLLGVGIVVMIFLAVWSFRLSRTSVVQKNGPIVGRLRREAEAAQPPTNLNQLKIDP